MKAQFRIQILRVFPGNLATMGECYINGKLTAMTLELPWKDNAGGISSIPEGTYKTLLRYDKARDGHFTIQLEGTGPRTGIQIHVGNKPDDITGCILLGLSAKYSDSTVGASVKAIKKLKSIFYGSEQPISCPDLEVTVNISSVPTSLRFYPSANDRSFFWVYDNGYWNGVGGTTPSKFKEVIRDCDWIISRSEDGGSFTGRYVRWGTLGGTPFQISKDLKNWTTLAPDELLVREPLPKAQLWSLLRARGGGVRALLEGRFVATTFGLTALADDDGDDDPAPPDPVTDRDDGVEDGVIHLDFDEPEFDGEVISPDDPDTVDDYSDYEDDYDQGEDDRGDEDRGDDDRGDEGGDGE